MHVLTRFVVYCALLVAVQATHGQPSPVANQRRIFDFSASRLADDTRQIALAMNVAINSRPPSRVEVDHVRRTVGVSGTAEDLAVAEWLFGRLLPGADGEAATDWPHRPEFNLSTGERICVFYLKRTEPADRASELTILVRSITSHNLFTHLPGAIVARATPEQIALAAWLLEKTITSPDGPRAAGRAPEDFRLPEGPKDSSSFDAREKLVRAFYLAEPSQDDRSRALTNLIRSVTWMGKVFTHTRSNVVLMRGTSEAVDLGEWLLTELDKPDSWRASHDAPSRREFRLLNADNPYPKFRGVKELVKIVYPAHPMTLVEFLELSTQLGMEIWLRNARDLQFFWYVPGQAWVFRGTPEQLVLADDVVAKLLPEKR